MLIVENTDLQLHVIDPSEDYSLTGSRYCSGGQIFQVIDRELGPLFSGPTYPEKYNTFDSQGLPDAFNRYPGLREAAFGDLIVAIGVGLVRYTHEIIHSFARENTEVTRPLSWTVEPSPGVLECKAHEQYGDYAYELRRRVELINRRIRITHELKNTGRSELPVRWFAHPFFPHTKNFVVGNIPSDLRLNRFYARDGEALRLTIPEGGDVNFGDAFIDGKPLERTGNLVIPVRHDLLGYVEVECGFPVDALPFWYNRCTFSPEPFFLTSLASGQRSMWGIRYDL